MATPLPVDITRQRRLAVAPGRASLSGIAFRWLATSAMAAWIVVAGVAAMTRKA